jgi:LysR family hydrogen peroxide-inducible transcriptional activator
MTLTQLSYIVAVDTHAHFGKAAQACYVTQPALSMQIGKLERELGVVIFDRSRTPVVTTDLGRQIVDQARIVLREATRIPELRDRANGVIAGELRVGVLPTLGPYLLPRFVRDLAVQYPQLRLVLEEAMTDTILERLRNETLDIGITAAHDADDLDQQPLFEEPFIAYVNSAHALAARDRLRPSDLERQDCWVLSEAHCLREQVLRLCSVGAEREPNGVHVASGNLEMLKRLVETSGGYTLLPVLAVESMQMQNDVARLVEFEEPAPNRQIVLLQRRQYLKGHLVEVFVAALRDSLPPTVRVSRSAAPLRRSKKYYANLGLAD